MAARKDPQAVLKKWQTNAQNSVDTFKAGVNAVTVAPTQQAANAADLWQQRVSSADAKAKFTNNLQKVSLADWKTAMMNKGVNNYTNGVREGSQKMLKFLNDFLPVAQASSDQISSMPKGTEQASIDRMVTNMRNMKAYSKS